MHSLLKKNSRMDKSLLTILPVITLACSTITVSAQKISDYSATEIYHDLEKLSVLGSALYVAAHPDDENTRLIAHLSNALHIETTYLSLTRGDGGQNLIGPELRERLGVIRTQELLQAREIDGGNQLFSRANDFGYSKSPEETLEFWGKEEILSDVVWAIRKVQPDIIINRFPHYHISGNHGHHTASAMLSFEAFDLAADQTAFTEQLEYYPTWQPSRMYFNTSWWFYGSRERFEKEADLSNMVAVDVGPYDPLRGYSDSELAAMSRSMHKSQGFGVSTTRGETLEYLDLVKGDWASGSDEHTLFEGLDLSWSRIEGGEKVKTMLDLILRDFSFTEPVHSVDDLFRLKQVMMELPDHKWKQQKLHDLDNLILKCLGLYVEAGTGDQAVAPGDSLHIDLELTQRTQPAVHVTGIDLPFSGKTDGFMLEFNQSVQKQYAVHIPENAETSSPYWLEHHGTIGRYAVPDQKMRGKPETPEPAELSIHFDVNGQSFSHKVPVKYKATDPVEGEITRPFEILPPVYVDIEQPVIVLSSPGPETINISVKANTSDFEGTVELSAGAGWTITPSTIHIQLTEKGESKRFAIEIQGPDKAGESVLKAIVRSVSGNTYSKSYIGISYPHIDYQSILVPAESRLVQLDLQMTGMRIGYIEGAGDAIPEGLREIGYNVEIIDPKMMSLSVLETYDAVITGIRAYNTVPELANQMSDLMKYVDGGGTLIVQYNTSRSLVTDNFAPYPIKLGRGRVTDETAEIRFLNPDHTVLNNPNKLTQKDFEGWVQERGLYFASEWDDAYEPILSLNDPGEEPLDGSLLITEYGKGHYAYVSLSLFRQIPEGVPGAYRLLANLIALGQGSKS